MIGRTGGDTERVSNIMPHGLSDFFLDFCTVSLGCLYTVHCLATCQTRSTMHMSAMLNRWVYFLIRVVTLYTFPQRDTLPYWNVTL